MLAPMRRSLVFGAFLSGLFACGGCAIPTAIGSFDEACPPPELGRPQWVRVGAEAGTWIGGAIGGVLSIVGLPVTWPLSLLAGDKLGDSGKTEFLFFPALSGAAVGHGFLGGACDVVDFVFYRGWCGEEGVVGEYELVPQPEPVLPPGAGAGGVEGR
jgi:hypothetical protein